MVDLSGARASPTPKITISAKLHLKEAYEHEIGLKMLEMVILKPQIFKIFWGTMPPDPPRKLVLLALVVLPRFENPRSAPVLFPSIVL